MKERFFIIIIVVMLSIVLGIVLKFRKKIEIKNIEYLHFSYTTGYAINSNVKYDLKYKNSKYIAIIKPNEISEKEAKQVDVDEKTVKKIEKVLIDNNIQKWNDFHKVDKYVLDGDSFSFNLKLKDNNYISASGYMRWPSNYDKVRSELDKIFMSLYKQ